ncbi:hypothetical protein D3C76_1026040 [compost metagenome]
MLDGVEEQAVAYGQAAAQLQRRPAGRAEQVAAGVGTVGPFQLQSQAVFGGQRQARAQVVGQALFFGTRGKWLHLRLPGNPEACLAIAHVRQQLAALSRWQIAGGMVRRGQALQAGIA